MRTGFLYVYLLAMIFTVSQADEEFNYIKNDAHGPLHWGQSTPQCASTTRQSPINIDESDVVRVREFSATFTCDSDIQDRPATLSNNGRTLTALVTPGCSTNVLGVPDLGNGEFKLVSFEIHFSDDNSHGSEHEFDGEAFPAELQFLHMNKKYNTQEEALKNSDGLIMVVNMLELSDVAHPEIKDIIEKADSLKTPKSPEQSLTVDLYELVGRSWQFYTYAGSLTCPPCSETVQWFIMYSKLSITQEQLEILREMRTGEMDSPLISEYGNCRPVQPLNERKVYANFPEA